MWTDGEGAQQRSPSAEIQLEAVPIRTCLLVNITAKKHSNYALFWSSWGWFFVPLPSSCSSPTLFDYEAEDKVVSQGQSVAAPPAGILIRLGAALWYIRHPLILQREHFSRGSPAAFFPAPPLLFSFAPSMSGFKNPHNAQRGKNKEVEWQLNTVWILLAGKMLIKEAELS